jgi:hypothetical protein
LLKFRFGLAPASLFPFGASACEAETYIRRIILHFQIFARRGSSSQKKTPPEGGVS